MTKWEPTIGLEVHCQLKTRSKLFCRSLNDPDETRPNVNVCPVCLAHPGTLPVLNREAVRQVLRVGLALGGRLANFTEFDRKNYFYPDLPKGYQITQYGYPLVSGGQLADVAITRVHLEEDTGRLQHDPAAGLTLVDFNRAGVPLMELVTEPVITSAKQAGNFARELQLLFRYLGVSDADMEKGQMRVEANVSLSQNSKLKDQKLGTKTEIKNLNSFRAVERAIDYELERQRQVLATGGKLVQETRGWDEVRGETRSQREKESSHDYRYFPDPDIPKLYLNEIPEFQNLAATLPELPAARRTRLTRLGLSAQDVEAYVAVPTLGDFFDQIAAELKEPVLIKLASNYIANDLVNLLAGDFNLLTKFRSRFAEFIKLIAAKSLSSHGAKKVLGVMLDSAENLDVLIEKHGLAQTSDEEDLKKIAQTVIADNPKVVTDYRSGKPAALQFLIGQAMRASGGTGNPQVFKKILVDILLPPV